MNIIGEWLKKVVFSGIDLSAGAEKTMAELFEIHGWVGFYADFSGTCFTDVFDDGEI